MEILLVVLLIADIALNINVTLKLRGTKNPRPPSSKDSERTVLVKRTRPNFRSVTQKPRVEYQEYRTKQGLYAPRRPGVKDDPDGVEIGGKR